MTETVIHPHLTLALLREALQTSGYRVEEGQDQDGALILRSATGGMGFEARFANPLPGETGAWADAAFRVVFQVQGELPLMLLNQWNATRRFSRLALVNSHLLMEMDMVVLGGITADNLRAQIGIWDRLVNQLIAYLREELPRLAKPAPVAEPAEPAEETAA